MTRGSIFLRGIGVSGRRLGPNSKENVTRKPWEVNKRITSQLLLESYLTPHGDTALLRKSSALAIQLFLQIPSVQSTDLSKKTGRRHNSSLEKRTAVKPEPRGCHHDLGRPTPRPWPPSWAGPPRQELCGQEEGLWPVVTQAAFTSCVGAHHLQRVGLIASGFLEAFLHFYFWRHAIFRVTSLLMTSEGM